MTNTLTERRKADRSKMADALASLARAQGATVAVEPEGSCAYRPHRIVVRVEAARGLRVAIDFDGKSCQPDVHVMSWNFDLSSDARLSDRFARLGSINEYHHRKATYVAHGFEALCFALEFGLTLARDGTAFDVDREAAAIAKDGTAAEQNARWQPYFDSVAEAVAAARATV